MSKTRPDAGTGRSTREPRDARSTTTSSSYSASAYSSSTYNHDANARSQTPWAHRRLYEELWVHAVRMNISAKLAEDPQHRQRFYAEKCWAVSRAIVLGGARVDGCELTTGLLSVSFVCGGRLHVPVGGLSTDACARVRGTLLNDLSSWEHAA